MSSAMAEMRERFGLDWTTLLAGWRGFGTHRQIVSLAEIRDFAQSALQDAPAPKDETVSLAIVSDLERDAVEKYLKALAAQEGGSSEDAKEKWIVILLKRALRDLPSDPLYGLLALTDFWTGVGLPAGSPHRIQGVGNDASPAAYYTAGNFAAALVRHRHWIETETSKLTAPRPSPAAT